MDNIIVFGAVKLISAQRRRVLLIACRKLDCSVCRELESSDGSELGYSRSAPLHLYRYFTSASDKLVQHLSSDTYAVGIKTEFLCWTEDCKHKGLPLTGGFERHYAFEMGQTRRATRCGLVLTEPRAGAHAVESTFERLSAAAVREHFELVAEIVRDSAPGLLG